MGAVTMFGEIQRLISEDVFALIQVQIHRSFHIADNPPCLMAESFRELKLHGCGSARGVIPINRRIDRLVPARDNLMLHSDLLPHIARIMPPDGVRSTAMLPISLHIGLVQLMQ